MKKLVLIFGFLVALPAVALEIPSGDYKGREDVAEFVQRMAAETDYTEAELVQLFSQVEKQEHLFALGFWAGRTGDGVHIDFRVGWRIHQGPDAPRSDVEFQKLAG